MKSLSNIEFSPELLQSISAEQAWYYRIFPKQNSDLAIEFFIDEDVHRQTNPEAELEIVFGKPIILHPVSSSETQEILSKYYRRQQKQNSSQVLQVKASEDFLVNLILEAKQLGSSDIHIEAFEQKCRVRIRIDGHLIERYTLNKNDYPSLINKIKIKANLDISEKRLPQDGRIFFNHEGEKFDIRVSVLPTLHGEKIVMRLLSNDATNIDINYLGFSPEELEKYLEGIKKPHGIILISGPTGSGKTTTLYATLKILNTDKVNITTIEDPIEYTLDGINQTQLKEDIGLTFASALRTFLRQDPDVIMLGEIRDGETAQMAIRAALTGHLVLSTIHTNSAWGTVNRLIDMGVPPFLLASTLNTSVAQRLVRVLCPECKTSEPWNDQLFPKTFSAPRKLNQHHVPKGCDHCYYTGYKGRKALYEIIPIDVDLAENIKSNNFNVAQLLKEKKIKTLKDNAFELLEKGVTSIDEVYSLLMNAI